MPTVPPPEPLLVPLARAVSLEGIAYAIDKIVAIECEPPSELRYGDPYAILLVLDGQRPECPGHFDAFQAAYDYRNRFARLVWPEST